MSTRAFFRYRAARKRATRLAGLMVSIAVVYLPRPAEACDCMGPSLVLPNIQSTDVPSNTKIWIESYGCEAAELHVKGGDIVETTESTITVGRSLELMVLHPTQLLEIGVTYELQRCSNLVWKPEFTVTKGEDATPPGIPEVVIDAVVNKGDDGCGAERYAPLHVTTDGELLLLDVAARASVDPSAISGHVVDVTKNGLPWTLGEKACGTNWDFADEGDATSVRVGAFDLAGNFSDWSAGQTVSAPDDGGCGCGAVGRASFAGSWAVVTLIAAALVRRRRRPAERW